MATPRFSILIPTRERPATFRHTLQTVVMQPGEDYEIVIADNCSGPETRAIVDSFASPRVSYQRSSEILPMAENWERGLARCSGEYVTVLGDDDGLVCTGLDLARTLVQATAAQLFSWRPHIYWWPDTIIHWNRNRLYVRLGNGATWIESRDVLEQFYRGTVPFDFIPMIYNAFMHRSLIDQAKGRLGAFFVPRDVSPDIAAGILALTLTEKFAHSARPLSIRGNSGKSTGVAHFARALGAMQRGVYYREERAGVERFAHASLISSPNLAVLIASVKLKCKEAFFPQDDALQVDPHGVLREMIAQLNVEPEAYEENLADVRALAAKLGVPLDPAEIPPKRPQERPPAPWGPILDADKEVSTLGVNCELLGIGDIAHAARLVEALLSPAPTYLTK